MTLVFILFSALLFYQVKSQTEKVVAKHGDDVQLMATGDTTLIIPDVLALSLPETCTGQLDICYEAESTTCNGQKCSNYNERCPSGSCIINYGKENLNSNNLFVTTTERNKIIGTMQRSLTKYCPLKTGGPQNFNILKMPNCPVTIIGAALPPIDDEDAGNEETTTASAMSETSVRKAGVAQWALPVGIGSVILLFIGAISAFGIYKCVKKRNNTKALKPKPLSLQSNNDLPKSPNPSPSSPVTIPPQTPQTPTVTTTPQNIRSPVVPPKSEFKRDAQTHVGTPQANKRDKTPNHIQKAAPTSKTQNLNTTETTATVEISPPYEVVARLIEDAARSLNRHGMLRFKGVHPIEVSSRPPFLQHVHQKYQTTGQRRQIDDNEVKFFLSSASDAFKEAKDKLKRIRQDLSRHGAIYELRRWRSFRESTYQYIRLPSTPGFTAWFAFSGEYGQEVSFKGDHADIKSALRKFSVPALLTVFFREELSDFIRQSALVRLRKLLPQIERLFPEIQLLGMPYPLNLIPAMKRFDSALFYAAAKEKSVTPPDDVVLTVDDKEDATDETQVTASNCGCCSAEEALDIRRISK